MRSILAVHVHVHELFLLACFHNWVLSMANYSGVWYSRSNEFQEGRTE